MASWTEARLVVTTRRLKTPAEALAAVRSMEGAEGWLQTTDTVYARRAQDPNWVGVAGKRTGQQLAGDAIPLDSEICLDSAGSVTLRHVDGAWLWSQMREVGQSDETGHPCSWQQAEYIANWRPDGKGKADVTLQYHVAWKQVRECSGGAAVLVWRPWLARFVGFGGAGN
ncbi:MAG: hypothetical protein FJ100_16770 [Deltaproteobacteria bacterium]|nr:hypothetical protein [Deltaproteobacteria bacterium]